MELGEVEAFKKGCNLAKHVTEYRGREDSPRKGTGLRWSWYGWRKVNKSTQVEFQGSWEGDDDEGRDKGQKFDFYLVIKQKSG